ncbi:MAG: AraC family transcriptional regulator [Alcanivoracaceae bacterium]|nr:AraC family transcriptional regulator [Alcanivoracaceae bacterium]
MSATLTARLRPSIHPTYARILCAWLRQQGHDTESIFRGTRLSWQQLLEDNRFISLEQMARLVRRGIALTGMPWLGLDVGQATQTSSHGPVGYAAIAAPDVRTMLQVITDYAPLRLQVLDYSYTATADGCELGAREALDLGDAREYVFCANATVLFLLVMATTGESLRGIPVQFPFPEPPWSEHYRTCFGDNVRFDGDSYRVRVPARILALPNMTADPAAHQQSLRDCQRQMKQLQAGGALTQQIRFYLLDHEGQYPTLEAMAEHLGMSRRTLIRHLKQEGASYQELLDDVRKELAVWYLENTALPVEQVAEVLGYQDTSNFSRTFRRWFATTPRAVRNGQGV